MGDACSTAQLIAIGGLLRSILGGGRRHQTSAAVILPGASLSAELGTSYSGASGDRCQR